MTISNLTTSEADALAAAISKLEGLGYPRTSLTKSLTRYLADCLTTSNLTTGYANLLAGISNELSGGSISARTTAVNNLLVSIVNAGDTPAYQASAVHFDGSTWANIAALSGIPDSPLVTFSVWLRMTADPGDYRPVCSYDTLSAGIGPSIRAGGTLDWYGSDHLGDNGSDNRSSAPLPFDGAWHHWFAYMDIGHNAEAMIARQWLDGVEVTGTNGDFGSAATQPFGHDFAMPNNASGLLIADLADLMWYPGQLLTDVSVFRDPDTGKPKDPATFPQGAVMLSGNAASFLANTIGTAGSLTVRAGTLTNAGTSPSD